ncbi:RNA polymerase sigma factor [Gracilimonas sp.]|uniref:RNA polymerase sigma factor n=1 Tax=Gracilimonas sp. TaxID=1974203 RepID=UPI002870EFCF|nr:RNA polymerase sigma factor [Gracilimonas sp.]
MLSKGEENNIITRAIQGDQSSFKVLYDEHIDALFAFLHQFSDERGQVKDWTQRAFMKAFQNLHSFNKDSRFKTWLFSIALNEMRMDKRSEFHFQQLDDADSELITEPETEKPEKWLKAKHAIKQLEPDKRIVFLLSIAEEYTHKEIGSILNIPEGHSRVILHRAKKELQQVLLS